MRCNKAACSGNVITAGGKNRLRRDNLYHHGSQPAAHLTLAHLLKGPYLTVGETYSALLVVSLDSYRDKLMSRPLQISTSYNHTFPR